MDALFSSFPIFLQKEWQKKARSSVTNNMSQQNPITQQKHIAGFAIAHCLCGI